MKITETSTSESPVATGITSQTTPATSNPLLSRSFEKSAQNLFCFSHLRWNFVYQRPQHLLSRASKQWRIWFIEEPIWGNELKVEVRAINDHLNVVVPHVKHGTPGQDVLAYQRRVVDQLLESERITDFMAWYYTPMALEFTDHLKPQLTIYDCMDELSAFLGAPPQLIEQEKRLMQQADIVFTGGYSLYEAKQTRHPRVFAFPSSIDYNHFCQARRPLPDPTDQRSLPNPRVGFCGVIDERFDCGLFAELAQRRSDWQFVLLGPTVKVDPACLPKASNIHYLGMKTYQELPAYFSNWDVAMMPFALNESTRFISPTKTPEYLSAGLPVVSTPIRDVVRTYGSAGHVQIADDAKAFEQAIEAALLGRHPANWEAIDGFLAENSWDKTWSDMARIMQGHLQLVTEQ
ncbi:glycosyltransferase family 1 protein [Nibrella saemangeumensis]|uniref:Glycosyltransferase family 1 protein n=1 Tax=Nibrella saemangeumensis TaxID=1084526 RepID=A0ABP8ML17_9BACT